MEVCVYVCMCACVGVWVWVISLHVQFCHRLSYAEYLYARARVRAQAVHIREVRESCGNTENHSAFPEYSVPIQPCGPSEDPTINYCELRHMVRFAIYLVHIHVHHASLVSNSKTLL